MADPDLFDAFVVARSPSLLRTAYLLTHDRGLAEDLVQTTLTKTWFALGTPHRQRPGALRAARAGRDTVQFVEP